MEHVGKYIIHIYVRPMDFTQCLFLGQITNWEKKPEGPVPFSKRSSPSKIPIVYRCCEAEEPGA